MATDLLIMCDALRVMILGDLHSVERQIAAYPEDQSVWRIAPGIANSGGNLALHIAGNLRYFIGAILGGSGYVRDRDAEFAARDLSRDALSAEIMAAIAELDAAFDRITQETLETVYPLPIRDRRLRTADFLLHLAVHLGYHLGQLDYHRRLLTPDPAVVENLSPTELPERS
ncbi:MAG: DUF1572 domain-containing protein [Gemmatimonadota bacterium]|nr:DUF1572 domain-containing protein [Gemmatimonadota bacterium]